MKPPKATPITKKAAAAPKAAPESSPEPAAAPVPAWRAQRSTSAGVLLGMVAANTRSGTQALTMQELYDASK